MTTHRLAIIIPTKDRPALLARLLTSIARQSHQPEQVIIVDGGKPSPHVWPAAFPTLPIEYLQTSQPSLTRQKNLGVRALQPGITLVAFLDDDIILDDDALANMLAFWHTAPADVGGAAFAQHGSDEARSSALRWLRRAFLIQSGPLGTLERSGYNVPIARPTRTQLVEWINGGCSCWRREVFNSFLFDEWFERNGLLEDVQFSCLVSARYRLAVVAEARVTHDDPRGGVRAEFRYGRDQVRNRLYVVRQHARFSELRCWWALFGQWVLNALGGVVTMSPSRFARAVGNSVGWLAIWRHSWWVVGLFALALRIGVAWRTGGLAHPQVFEWHDMALLIVSGYGFVYPMYNVPHYSFDAPLYPYLTALVYALSGNSPVAMIWLQIVVGTIFVMVTGVIGARLFGTWAGIIAALIVAVHPGFLIYTSLKAHSLIFDALLFSLIIWQALRVGERRTLQRSLWLGALIGVGTLERPTAIMFLPVALAWLWMTAPRAERSRAARHALATLAVLLMVLAPWLIRCAVIHQQFVFVRSLNWEVFWRGNNPHATGHSYVHGRLIHETLPPGALEEVERLPNEIEQGKWFRDRALAWIREHPADFVRLTLKKLWAFWWFGSDTGTKYVRSWLVLYQVFYAVMAGLALLGLWFVATRGSPWQQSATVLIVLSLLALSFGQALHYVEGRHRWGIEAWIATFAGLGATSLRSLFLAPLSESKLRCSA